MSTFDELLERIAAAPQDPAVAAVFDLDGTVTAKPAARGRWRRRRRADGPAREVSVDQLLALADETATGHSVTKAPATKAPATKAPIAGEPMADVASLITDAIGRLAGKPEDEVVQWGRGLFRSKTSAILYPQIRTLIDAHRRAGHRVILATSATRYQAVPIAADLEFDDVLATDAAVNDGVLTGELTGDVLWGPNKAAAVRNFAARSDFELEHSFAYADGAEDLALLEAVGRPTALNPDEALTTQAEGRGWATAALSAPGNTVTPAKATRMAAALVSLFAGALLGAVGGLLTWNRRTAANIASWVTPKLVLSAFKIKVDITGVENASSYRPAVFVFNHQSSLDMIIVGTVLRRDFTGVAKIEAKRDPRFAPIGALFGIAYVDRADPAKARAALAPAVLKLRTGISVAMAPEGTRMPTRRLGAFKKGAFHLAMQAGVPIIPIIIHNAGELMWRGAMVSNPGTIRVTVGDPITTADWTAADIDTRIAQVRQVFENELQRG